MPNPNASAGGGSLGETGEVVSRPPPMLRAIDIDLIPDAGKKRVNVLPPGGSIGARLKKAKIAAASAHATTDDIEEGNKKPRASNRKSRKSASAKDSPRKEFYESNWVFRSQIPKRTADEIRSMEPLEFLALYDDDCDAHSTMLTEMRFRFEGVVKALEDSTHRESLLSNNVIDLEKKLADYGEDASVVDKLKEKETLLKS
uniref:uncharacterized protein LOC122586344 n=1 Tax=Erigeron canadensis TaxID=72917 RepID=UPI001CB8AEC9|nr:uncharacterized protein LOC122586344 [Erigeron canadensis]